MISGDFGITENKIDYNERTMKIELCVVTDENSDKSSDKFLEELEALLDKYAI